MLPKIISLFIHGFIFLIINLSLFSCQPITDSSSETGEKLWLAEAPAGNRITQINYDGETITPLGRIIKPYGKTHLIAPHPFGLTLSPDGQTLVTANSGTVPLSISILQNIFGENPEIRQVPEGASTDKGILASVFMGLAVSPDNQKVYVGGGQENVIYIFELATGKSMGKIDCAIENDSVDYSHGYIGDLKITGDGNTIYAVDQINFRVIEIDVATNQVKSNIGVGRYPFGICLSKDEKTAFVANVGMYEYKWIEGIDPKNLKETTPDYMPFAYQSEEAEKGIQSDSLNVPGLGELNAPESFSVWAINLTEKKIISKVKTGFLVGEVLEGIPAVGGSSPNSLVASEQFVFVSNGNNDCVSVLDIENHEVVKNIFLKIDERISHLRGVIPFGLALSPDQKRLYVAESGLNAVGVIDVESLELIGHIPVGWFPSKLEVSKDGKKLVVANAKGFGSGPNGGTTFEKGPEGSYIGGLMKGSVTVLEIPDDEKLKSLTQQVLENNFKFTAIDSNTHQNPVPKIPGIRVSPIKHIVFVSKENRTYDEVFGQIKKGKGEPELARFGYEATFSNRDKTKQLESVTVMPNHLALAKRFSISDNFYVNADHSADGHRWLVGTYPNEWVETSVTAAYGGNRNMKWDSKAPGNLAFEGASGAIYPEDYNEAGSIWEHLERNKIDFWNFGFGTMFAPHITDISYKYSGYHYAINYPVPAPIFDKTSRIFPTYNTAIPDQFRIDQFIQEFDDKWINGQDTMPQVLTVIIGNDHGAGERPNHGYPFHESYMADNDLALGRLVEYLSTTPYWKNMAIVVTEDDSQGGVDHIDAHRSILMVISPYAKSNFVSHEHTSFGSIFKTFWNILGIPYLNQYDATATDLSDCFSNQPDFTPFKALPIDKRLFDPDLAYDPLDEEFEWEALEESPVLDDPEYLIKESKFQDEQ